MCCRIWAGAVLLMSAACGSTPEPTAGALARAADEYWEFQMRTYPRWATYLGDPRYNDRLDEIGPAAREAVARFNRALIARLDAIDREALGDSDRVTYDLLRLFVQNELESLSHKFYQWDIDQMDGPQVWLARMLETQPLKTDADYENLLRRYAAFPRWMDGFMADLQEGLTEGRVAPKIAVTRVISQLEEILATPVERSVFLTHAGPRLRLKITIETEIYPAYRKLLAFLSRTYLPRCAESFSLSNLPGGPEAYRFRIRHHTTLPLSADEVHQIGLDQIRAIHDEMNAIGARLGHEGDAVSLIRRIGAVRENFASSGEELMAGFREVLGRVDALLPAHFGTLPRTPYVVEPMPPYQQKHAPAAYYEPPPTDGSRPGRFKANLYRPEARPRYTMAALAVHEAVPGHHLQIALAQEQRGLPTFRRNGQVTAFVEGWGLYSERLADEMGVYRDDLERFGMLTYQAWRAARLVVDSGIHAKGWTRDQAMDFFERHVGLSGPEMANEIDRYIVWPGQALAYMIGQRQILRLRDEARRELGDRFDLRRFHDRVLLNGPLPLATLEDIIRRWIADQKR
jgi:uncharacterized protein (DUF885 family)